ncbi:hypothetical protein NDU88_001173 [Pleurodeles waltl]|uniref:Uncharacterized protein n=1 Tax=Pleurodeles waltl TaxID=8319 RepID=A0AAV7SYH2_PLEWA|nr:hypothetical protein NDU88_001173 [Pleurodeles waltl]
MGPLNLVPGAWLKWTPHRSLSSECRHRPREISDRAPRHAACRHSRGPRCRGDPLDWPQTRSVAWRIAKVAPRQATSDTEASKGPAGDGGVKRPGLLGDVISGAPRRAAHWPGWRLLGPWVPIRVCGPGVWNAEVGLRPTTCDAGATGGFEAQPDTKERSGQPPDRQSGERETGGLQQRHGGATLDQRKSKTGLVEQRPVYA